MDEQSRQRVAAHRRHSGRATKRSWTHHPLRWSSEEEMGSELGFHGALRIRMRSHLLGRLGIPHVVRGQLVSSVGKNQRVVGPEVPVRADLSRKVSERHDDLLSVRVRGHHSDSDSRSFVGKNEFLCLDAFCASVVDVFVYVYGV